MDWLAHSITTISSVSSFIARDYLVGRNSARLFTRLKNKCTQYAIIYGGLCKYIQVNVDVRPYSLIVLCYGYYNNINSSQIKCV